MRMRIFMGWLTGRKLGASLILFGLAWMVMMLFSVQEPSSGSTMGSTYLFSSSSRLEMGMGLVMLLAGIALVLASVYRGREPPIEE
ncbi:MAG: hypothetical protein GKC10_03365 [Methanosarcinales archaeon]|nr:hypothetical protein [Methanosarcinales archaeon]